MHRLLEYMFLPNQRQDPFSISARKYLGPTHPFLCFKNNDIFTRIQQKRPSQTPVVARFRDTYEPNARKFSFSESRERPFQVSSQKTFRSHSRFSIFEKQRCFHSHSGKTTMSDTCGSCFQRHVCTDFQKKCF